MEQGRVGAVVTVAALFVALASAVQAAEAPPTTPREGCGTHAAVALDAALVRYSLPGLTDVVRLLADAGRGAPLLVCAGVPTAAAERLLEALGRIEDHGLPPSAYLLEAIAAARAGAAGSPEQAAELDVLLVRAFVRLALDLAPPDEDVRPTLAGALARARAGASEMADTLRAWLPASPDYAALVVAHRTLRAAVAGGDTAGLALAKRGLAPGKRHDDVPALKRRLALLGFYRGALEGPDGTLYDTPLREAVGHFQYAHGVPGTGDIDPATRRALAVPLTTRAAEVALGLARLRGSRTRSAQTYLRVNVPQYEAELVVDGRKRRTFRVVVGDDRVTEDPATGERGHWNRTPVLEGSIDRVILNPVWRVPRRIRAGELEPREARDPGYLERNGFLVRGESIVQEPGPTNPLGRVKLAFDNEAGIYLHDTPERSAFKRARRALSHGCVRVEGVLELAVWLLAREGHEAAARVDAILAAGGETELHLATALPLFVEYVTVKVDGEGRVVFLEDVYGQDGIVSRRAPRSAP